MSTELQRKVFSAFVNDKKVSDIAEEFKMTQEQVRTILKNMAKSQ